MLDLFLSRKLVDGQSEPFQSGSFRAAGRQQQLF